MSLLSLNSPGFTLSTEILSFVSLLGQRQATPGLLAPFLPETRLFMSIALSLPVAYREAIYQLGSVFELYSMRQGNSHDGLQPILMISPNGPRTSFRFEYRVQLSTIFREVGVS